MKIDYGFKVQFKGVRQGAEFEANNDGGIQELLYPGYYISPCDCTATHSICKWHNELCDCSTKHARSFDLIQKTIPSTKIQFNIDTVKMPPSNILTLMIMGQWQQLLHCMRS